jgi:hypothetical protein
METNKETLQIVVDSLTDNEWNEIKRLREVKQAFQKAEIFNARRTSAIQFGDWILKHNVLPSYDDEGSACWVLADGAGKIYTSLELYNAYINGEFDEYDDYDDELED